MAFDPGPLAQNTLAILVPFLPYLRTLGNATAEAAAKKLGEDAWKFAKDIWSKLRSKAEAKPPFRTALENLARDATDANAQAAFREQLLHLLSTDNALAEGVARLVDESQRAGSTVLALGERSVAIGGDVKRTTIATGNETIIQ